MQPGTEKSVSGRKWNWSSRIPELVSVVLSSLGSEKSLKKNADQILYISSDGASNVNAVIVYKYEAPRGASGLVKNLKNMVKFRRQILRPEPDGMHNSQTLAQSMDVSKCGSSESTVLQHRLCDGDAGIWVGSLNTLTILKYTVKNTVSVL